MSVDRFLHRLLVLGAATMTFCGVAMLIWASTHLPEGLSLRGRFARASSAAAEEARFAPNLLSSPAGIPSESSTNAPDESPLNSLLSPRVEEAGGNGAPLGDSQVSEPESAEEVGPAAVALMPGLPAAVTSALESVLRVSPDSITYVPYDSLEARIRLDWVSIRGTPIYREIFAAATRFDSINTTLSLLELRRAWRGSRNRFAEIVVLESSRPALRQLLGEPGPSVRTVSDMAQVLDAAWSESPTLTLVPFDLLDPRLVVLSLDGQNPIENSAHFDPARYGLAAVVYAHIDSDLSNRHISALLGGIPAGNRDPDRLTVVTMTGVTAMVRMSAEQMDLRGDAWPAEVVGPRLASADITSISNEVPFVPDCETNTDLNNLVFCSKPGYMETLTASGADIIGLTGNHQNDYGRTDALTSLEIYEQAGLPVYGGGKDLASAMAPLYIEHNGNRLAFLGVNSYGPPSAWATEFTPGSAPFDLALLSAQVRSIKEEGLADLVLVEFQYQESYQTEPLIDQRLDFVAVTRAGADIVTGVQSHVPQGIEFEGSKLVLYGLGNLYFDQMWSEATREGLIVEHTIYNGRHLSTQLLPTLLHDYGQPQWAEPERRAAILSKVFNASYWE